MSAKELISPYLNRFVDLLCKKSTAKVELSCKDGQMSINMFHEFGVIEQATPEAQPRMPSYNEVVRNNIPNFQARRLQKRANVRAEEARAQTKIQQEIAENAKHEFDKSVKDAEEARERAEKAKTLASKSKLEAENARKECEKYVKDAEEAKILASKAKFEAEKARVTTNFAALKARQEINFARKEVEEAEALKHRETEQTKQDMLKANEEEQNKKGEVISRKSLKSTSLKMNPLTLDNEVECEFCDEEFTNTTLLREHIETCPICELTFNEYPYCLTNHIRMNHGKYCCESCGECFIEMSEKKGHKKTCFKCDNCNKYLKTQIQLRKHSRKCVPSEEESTDENESSN